MKERISLDLEEQSGKRSGESLFKEADSKDKTGRYFNSTQLL